MQNSLEELWSLLNFLMPALFTSSCDFQQWFGTSPPNNSSSGDSTMTEEETLLITNRLYQVLRPFMLHRLKAVVANDLPGKASSWTVCLLYGSRLSCYLSSILGSLLICTSLRL